MLISVCLALTQIQSDSTRPVDQRVVPNAFTVRLEEVVDRRTGFSWDSEGKMSVKLSSKKSPKPSQISMVVRIQGLGAVRKFDKPIFWMEPSLVGGALPKSVSIGPHHSIQPEDDGQLRCSMPVSIAPNAPATANFDLGLAFGAWLAVPAVIDGTKLVLKPRSSSKQVQAAVSEVRDPSIYQRAITKADGPKAPKSGLCTTISLWMKAGSAVPRQQVWFEVRYAGKTVAGFAGSFEYENGRIRLSASFPIAKARIDGIHFKLRPVHKATFRNIALRPN